MSLILLKIFIQLTLKKNILNPKRKATDENSGDVSKKTKCNNLKETSGQPNTGYQGISSDRQQKKTSETDVPSHSHDKSNTESSVLDENVNSDHQTADTNELTDNEKLLLNRQEKLMDLEKGNFTNNDEMNNPLYEANVKSDNILNKIELSETCKICMECGYDLHIGPRNKMCD